MHNPFRSQNPQDEANAVLMPTIETGKVKAMVANQLVQIHD